MTESGRKQGRFTKKETNAETEREEDGNKC